MGQPADLIVLFESELNGGTPHTSDHGRPRVMMLLQFYHRAHEQWLYSQPPFQQHTYEGIGCPGCLQLGPAGPFDSCLVHPKLHAAPIPEELANRMPGFCLPASVSSQTLKQGLISMRPSTAEPSCDPATSGATDRYPSSGRGLTSSVGMIRLLAPRPNFWISILFTGVEFSVRIPGMIVQVRLGAHPQRERGRILLGGLNNVKAKFDRQFEGVQIFI